MTNKIEEFFQTFDIDFCRQYIEKYQAEERKEMIRKAELVMDNTFVFDHNWDMEPCQTPYHLDPIIWDRAITDDPEWNFMLNRQAFLVTLMTAYVAKADKAYLEKAKTLMIDWVDSNLILEPQSLACRTLDTGIRCFNWVKCLLFLIHFDVLTPEQKDKLLRSLEMQLHYLVDRYIDKYSLSNWGILQTTAILLAAYYFEDDIEIQEAKVFAEKELSLQVSLQVLEDGSQYEQSIMYHIEVFKALSELAILVPSYLPLLEKTLQKMAYYIQMMTGPDHKQIALGDSDQSDTRDILTLASILLQSPSLKSSAFSFVDVDSLMLFGKEGVRIFAQLKREDILPQSHHFESSGHICIKKDDYQVFFKSGPMGSAHTHSDQNSLCLYYKGKSVFIDPGRYTYKEEALRYSLKSAVSHSTCFIENKLPERIKDSWGYESYPGSQFCRLKEEGEFLLIEGFSQTTFLSEANYQHQRQVLILPNGIFIVLDRVDCQGSHTFTTQFVLDQNLRFENGCLADLRVISQEPFQEVEMPISKKYNQIQTSHKIVKKQTVQNHCFDSTIFVSHDSRVRSLDVYQVGSHQTLASAQAWEFKGADFHYIVAVLDQDIVKGDKLFMVEGIKCRGKVIVYDKKTQRLIRLKH